MPLASQYKSDERIFALFVARSGDGKSTAAASFPPKLIDLDFDYRFAGIDQAIRQGIIKDDGIEFQQFNPRAGWEPVDKWLTQMEQYRIEYQRTGSFPYKTIVIDSLGSMCRLLVVASHKLQTGRTLGNLRISGPADFNFEASGTHQIFDFLRTFPCNIICSAHIIDKYGKPKGDGGEYAQSVITGEKLSVRDNLGENVLSYFDNVFRFEREILSGKTKYTVNFATDIAKNAFGIPPGEYDITGKAFYPFLQDLIKQHKKAA